MLVEESGIRQYFFQPLLVLSVLVMNAELELLVAL